MNQRNKIKVKEKLSKIQSNKFEIDDVEILLINVREFARQNCFGQLLEFCDFVAHPDRNKGIIYEEFDIFYSKFKYMPTKNGDQLDYYNIDKNVFRLLFIIGIDKLYEDDLIKSLAKNREQLKDYIINSLVQKSGRMYKAKNENAVNELREIQRKIVSLPNEQMLTDRTLFSEIKTCVSALSKEIDFQYDEIFFNKCKNNLILCLFEIIQRCKIELHDGQKGIGFITVDSNNPKYAKDPKIENLNLSFSVQVPVQQSFCMFDFIATSIFIGDVVSDPNSIIEWHNIEHTSGKLKSFALVNKSNKS